jgi:transcriptional regulator with XRE-family HTH domain
MKFNGKELKEVIPAQREKLNMHMDVFNRNIKAIGLRASQDRERYNIPYTEIGAIAGVSADAVSDFLRGKSVPHLVTVSAICGAICMLKPQYALQTVTNKNEKKTKKK